MATMLKHTFKDGILFEIMQYVYLENFMNIGTYISLQFYDSEYPFLFDPFEFHIRSCDRIYSIKRIEI